MVHFDEVRLHRRPTASGLTSVVIVALVVLGGCTLDDGRSAQGEGPTSAPTTAAAPSSIDTTSTSVTRPTQPQPPGDPSVTWAFVSGSVAGKTIEPYGRPTLIIEGDQVRGMASCNEYWGSNEPPAVVGDGVFWTGEIAMTAVGCGEPFEEHEIRYVHALSVATEYRLDDGGERLIITGDEGAELVFVLPDSPDTPYDNMLLDTQWLLAAAIGPNGPIDLDLFFADPMTLDTRLFIDSYTFEGFSGCNTYRTPEASVLIDGEMVAMETPALVSPVRRPRLRSVAKSRVDPWLAMWS